MAIPATPASARSTTFFDTRCDATGERRNGCRLRDSPSPVPARERHAGVGAERRLFPERALRVVHRGAEDAARHERLGIAQPLRIDVALELLCGTVLGVGTRCPLGDV